MTELETLQHYYNDSLAFAKEWKAAGKKVIGYFCNSVPEELMIAAGFLPLRITGRVGGNTGKAAEMLGPSEGYSLSMLAGILDGAYSFLDYLIVPHARGSVHKIYSVLEKVRASNPGAGIPELYFLDKTHTTFMTSQLFNRERMLELKMQMEVWAGRKIQNEDLYSAADVCNESRALLKKLAYLRISGIHDISGTKALQIIGASMFMEKRAYNRLLSKYLAGIPEISQNDRVRLFFSGSPQDHLQLYELIESYGAVIVAEDHCWGNRWSDSPVLLDKEPMDAIIRRYNTKSPCPHIFPLQKRVDYCVKCAEEAAVQGAIFCCLKNDPQAWDVPDERRALEARKIPTLYLAKQKYPISDSEATKESLQGFIKECAVSKKRAADDLG